MNKKLFLGAATLLMLTAFLPENAKAAVSLTWQNDDPTIVKTQIFRTTVGTGALTAPNAQFFLAEVSSAVTSFRDTTVLPGFSYYYTLFNFDESGVYSDPASVYFTVNREGEGLPENPPPPPENTLENNDDKRVWIYTRLNVRSGPSSTAPVVAVANANTYGTIISSPTTVGGISWVQVRYDNGVTGWSAQNYLRPASSATSVSSGTPSLSDAQRQELIRQIQAQLVILIQKLLAALQAQGN